MLKTFILLILLWCACVPSQTMADLRSDELMLSQQEVSEAITTLMDQLDRTYLFHQRVPSVNARLLAERNSPSFQREFQFGRFQRTLTAILVDESDDTHFEIIERQTAHDGQAAPGSLPGGIATAWLNDTVFYLAIDGDLDLPLARAAFADALNAGSDATAVVIDLRTAGFGSVPLSRYLLSYFVAPDMALANIVYPHSRTERLMPVNLKQVRPSTDIPVYIIHSAFVGGAWEFFSYTLKHAGRATIIGEPTLGQAYLTKALPLSDHVAAKMVYAELRHPETGENWQGWGVLPHYKTRATEALDCARMLTGADNGERVVCQPADN
ncbi:S41 family peptidase [Alteromonas sp. CYL-A6]|uniref:S41 family peptidase n=1 Tax=Alteromonas nitratireducens TaxID=3390813 RepID=UPI0034A78C9F